MRQTLPILSICLTLLYFSGRAIASDELQLWYTKPANVWEEALPIGSGRLGAMVFGTLPDERIQFNQDTLWTGVPHNYDRAGAGDYLPQIRQLVFDGKDKEAAAITREHFLSDPVRQKAYQPFGDIHLHFPDHDQPTNYRRQLDLSTAIAETDYTVSGVSFKEQVFASYPDNVIVIRLTADQPAKLSFSVQMDSPHKTAQTQVSSSDTLTMTGQVLDNAAPFEPGERFESILKVTPTGGKLSSDGSTLVVDNADAVTLLLVAATSFKNFQDISADPASRCETAMALLKGQTFDSLLARHETDYQPLFGSVKLDLGQSDRAKLPTDERLHDAAEPGSTSPTLSGLDADPSLAALFFQFGRYMLISSSRPGTQPANLQGVWNSLLSPPWESKYTTNINVEMNYWPAEVTNLSQCHLPLFDMIHDLMISGGQTAHDLYHARGWVLHHNTDIWRGTAPINNIDGVWPTGGAWLCQHLWEHYQFTGDTRFLADSAYPAMKGASLFFVDSLVKDPNTGFMVTNPSFSPEQGTLCAGPAMDMQLIRSLFDSTMQAAGILRVDPDFVAQLAKLRSQLAPDKIGKYGQLQEWQDDVDKPNNNHRHMSPLWGIYPGSLFTPRDPKLFDAAKVLFQWRGDGSTGWSYAWRIPISARFGNGEFAYRQLSIQMAKRTFPDLFDKCGPFQVDGNFGATAGIAEMLLQSNLHSTTDPTAQELDLLPALPHEWPNGSVTALCARGGFEVDMTWHDGRLTQATIRSKLGSPCEVHYGSSARSLTTVAGKSYTLDENLK
jgi:alpha-L-fucosidase 2